MGKAPHNVILLTSRFPKLSETFIQREALALSNQGLLKAIFSMAPRMFTEKVADAKPLESLVNHPPISSFASAAMGLLKGGSKKAKEAFVLSCGKALARLVEEMHADLIHAHWATWPLVAAIEANRICGVPIGITVHAHDLYATPIATLAKRFEHVRYIIVDSAYNQQWLRKNFSDSIFKKVTLVHNGLDLVEFPFESTAGNDPPLVLAVGRLVDFKGFDTLIDALALLAKKKILFSAKIVGDGPLRKQLSNLIQKTGLSDRIELTGALPFDKVRDLMKRAGVMAVPSKMPPGSTHDGLPTVISEAMAVGTPVVATDVASIGEVIKNRQTGILIEPDKPDHLTQAIEDILGDDELRKQIRINARKLVEQDFDADKCYRKLVETMGEK